MLTYETVVPKSLIRVYLDGKVAGSIRIEAGLYCYFPKTSKTGGDYFKSLEECKKSLETS